jgi:hypothetical protein
VLMSGLRLLKLYRVRAYMYVCVCVCVCVLPRSVVSRVCRSITMYCYMIRTAGCIYILRTHGAYYVLSARW